MSKQEFISSKERQVLVNAIQEWRLTCKATANINETVSEIHKQSVIDADTPYSAELLDKAKKRNLAHVRELDIKSFWHQANAAGW